jgi:hypothetical protein
MRDRPDPDLFVRLPGHLRSLDARSGDRALQALMALFGREAGIVETDIDQLYDNWFVETCEPWALPYLAQLVGAQVPRDIGADQPGLLRAYVARVLEYRQAKGTAAALEQVARDVTGWPVVAVEWRERLMTSAHVNHVRPGITTASVRAADGARLAHRAFDPNAHLGAAGRPDGWSGRYNISTIGLMIWRQRLHPLGPLVSAADGYLGGPQPAPVPGMAPGHYRFDPLGRDLPLLNRPRPDTEIEARMTERTVPGRLRRLPLYRALEALRAGAPDPDGWFDPASPVLRIRLDGAEVPPARLFACDLSADPQGDWRRPATAGEVLFDPELGRIALHPDDAAKPLETAFALGAPFDIGGGPYDRAAAQESWLPRIAVPGEPPPWQIGVTARAQDVTDDPLQGGPVVATLPEAIARWNAEAGPGSRGIIVLLDNATHAVPGADAITVPPGATLAVTAAAWPVDLEDGGVLRRRPGRLSPLDRRPVVAGTLRITGTGDGSAPGRAIVDGLAITGGLRIAPDASLTEVEIHNATLGVADGELSGGVEVPGAAPALSLTMTRCIAGTLDLPDLGGAVRVDRSILTGLDAPDADVTLDGSTILGASRARTIHASNTLFDAPLLAARKQEGCLRYCALPPGSEGPRRHRCAPQADRAVFVARAFSRPGFGQLSRATPATILQGAEDGQEIGAGFANRDPARQANLEDAIAEFSPFGMTAGWHFMS